MKFSLVVCTRNRSAQLLRSLLAVDKLATRSSWELIVVDNGSTDDSAYVLSSLSLSSPKNLVVVQERLPGLGRARNAGVKASHGEFLVFIDDDCYPEPDFLDMVHECFAEGPESLGFVGGRVLLYDPTDLAMTIQTSTQRVYLKGGSFIRTGAIHGANMAFRRSALLDVNGFDDRLGSGTPFACEDVDILARMLARGWDGLYDPRPVVWHHHGRKTVREGDALKKGYDAGRGAYYAKCLLQRPLRFQCAKLWLRTFDLSQPTRVRREIGGAIQYWADTGVQWLRSQLLTRTSSYSLGSIRPSQNQ